jgi:leucyl aminopeptidase
MSKKLQKLFNFDTLQPLEMIESLEKHYGLESQELSNDGLLNMFRHPIYKPLAVTFDFSKGRRKDVMLLGKGVLYDSGGYNIKADASDMFGDKFGALTAIEIASQLKLPVTVFFVVNLIHVVATLPGEKLTSLNGKVVRVVDTDAEGRIGLAHIIELSKARKLISFATLTGHSDYAIDSGHIEVFSKDKKFLSNIVLQDNKVVAAGRYFDDYKNCLYKNKVLENLNSGFHKAGAAKAYAFLNEFLAKGQTLTHFDIAGIMDKLTTNHEFGLDELVKTVKLTIKG